MALEPSVVQPPGYESDRANMSNFLPVREPENKVRVLVKRLALSGDTDLDKENLAELKSICKSCPDSLMVTVSKECLKCLAKEHSQARVSTVKLIDYLFRKSHVVREKLLDNFDTFLELTLAVSQRPKIKLKLPPPKKYASLLQELTAKLINSWHADFACGYEKLRYIYRFLQEHRLVDFSQFQVTTREQLIQRQKLAEMQARILNRTIESKLKEFRQIQPEIEQLHAKIESLLDMLIDPTNEFSTSGERIETPASTNFEEAISERNDQRQHGIADLTHNIDIEFDPFLKVRRDEENKEVVEQLKELKKELVSGKLTRLVAIEKALCKRSEQYVGVLKELIDIKSKSMNVVLKLGELNIVNSEEDKRTTLDNADSDSSADEFEEVGPKEGLETYIPKNMRYEYGLESIDPKELEDCNKVRLTEETLSEETPVASSSSTSSLTIPCNVRLESGKLCPRRDKIKCPFHGKIIPRDHLGIPLDEQERLKEEKLSKAKLDVPDWQDPQLLRDIKDATGVDLTMPKRGKHKTLPKKKLVNTKTCDLTPKKRLERKLKKLNRC